MWWYCVYSKLYRIVVRGVKFSADFFIFTDQRFVLVIHSKILTDAGGETRGGKSKWNQEKLELKNSLRERPFWKLLLLHLQSNNKDCNKLVFSWWTMDLSMLLLEMYLSTLRPRGVCGKGGFGHGVGIMTCQIPHSGTTDLVKSIKIPHPRVSKGWLHTSNSFTFPPPPHFISPLGLTMIGALALRLVFINSVSLRNSIMVRWSMRISL